MNDLHPVTVLAQTNILRQGVSFPDTVSGIDVPSDYSHIPNLGENNIGDLMGRLASYIEFIEYQNSLAEVEHETWAAHLDFERKKIILTLPSERRDIMEAKADVQLEQLINSTREKYTRMKLMKSLLEGKKRILDTLSRELTRRALVSRTPGGQFNV